MLPNRPTPGQPQPRPVPPPGPAPGGQQQADPAQAKAAMIEALKVIRQVAKDNGLNFDELVATSAQAGATAARPAAPAPTRVPSPRLGQPASPAGARRPPSLPIE